MCRCVGNFKSTYHCHENEGPIFGSSLPKARTFCLFEAPFAQCLGLFSRLSPLTLTSRVHALLTTVAHSQYPATKREHSNFTSANVVLLMIHYQIPKWFVIHHHKPP